MKPALLWTPQAREDLLDIYVTIGLDNPSAAERVYTAIEDLAARLIAHPRLGVRRPEISPSARTLSVGPYLVLYQTHPDTDHGPMRKIEIVRIVHGHRDLSLVF